ncbi:ubiquitin-like with PHD and RING finger domains 2 [Linnemannia gamsii]|uniref:Ubiquitin-like with PHD and RING finger domains 2 n=1 Tax=Linnemannia gamsii TaxID=64522 RepID=A0ABQ7JMN2_9FUNG|nr:ubiquitin-like with PHD and RING finger domains 2 [Linnemannia gamsii]
MKVNFHLIQQPDRVEYFIVPSINTTIKRVRERIAEQYEVDESAFYMYYQDNKLDDDSTLNKSRFVDHGNIVIVPITYDKQYDYEKNSKVIVKANTPKPAPPTLPTSSRSSRSRSSSEQRSPYAKVKQEEPEQSPSATRRRPIPGIPVGTIWPMRIDASRAGIHRPAMAGISGQAEVGAESVALSGGYTDDDDKGYEFTYTGAGGNKGGVQTCNQEMTRANHGLAMTCDCPVDSVKGGQAKDWRKSRPIRVIRGYQLMNVYSPQAGYRYDGIYKVVKYWPEMGKAGFRIWRYLMRRDDPEAAPWETQTSIPAPPIPAPSTEMGSRSAGSSTSRIDAIAEAGLSIRNASQPLDHTLAKYDRLYPMNSFSTNQGPKNENQRLLDQACPGLSGLMKSEDIEMKQKNDLEYQDVCLSEAPDGKQDGHIGLPGLSDDDDTVVGDDAGIGDSSGIGVDGPDLKKEKVDESQSSTWIQEDRTTDQLLDDWA